MNWILLLPVAGILFLGLSVVDWALYRLEQNEIGQSRWKGFGASGLVLLSIWGAVVSWPTQPTWASGPALVQAPDPTLVGDARFTWQPELQPAFQLIATLLIRATPPTLAEARADRATLLEARRLLASRPPGSEEEEALSQQADTILGLTYQALADQWSLVRQGTWSAEGHADSLAVVKREWAKYHALAGCLTSGKADCLPSTARSERAGTIHAWQRALRLYLLDCLRFDETDPDLAWLPAQELRATRDRLQLGRLYLSDHPLPVWGDQVTAAADQLFQAADQALRVEETATAQGVWTTGNMSRAYRPVKVAWDLLFQEAFCAMETEGACVKKPR